jgi:hypothetical protein
MSHDKRIFFLPRTELRIAVRKVVSPVAALVLLALTACGGGGGGSTALTPGSTPSPIGSSTPPTTPTPGPGSSPTPTPTPVPTGPAVTVSASVVAFTAAGSGVPGQSVAAAQAQNTGGFVLSTTTCAGIVSAAPTTGVGPFTFLPIAAGTCTYLITGNGNATATVSITVTTTSIGSN